MNILCASDYVIMSVEASPWGLFGVANMFEFLEDVRRINEELTLLGIAITKVDTRKNYYKQTCEALRQTEGCMCFIISFEWTVRWNGPRMIVSRWQYIRKVLAARESIWNLQRRLMRNVSRNRKY